MAKKRIGIVGYGNLGRGVELSIAQNNDMELIGIFTRRDPQEITTVTFDANVYSIKDIFTYKDRIDVLILCGGSATDLVNQGPKYAESFNTVDSFDNHAKIPDYFAEVDEAAKKSGHLSLISAGWDPGLFSINRLFAESVLPTGKTYTFWGNGLSQGHSDAIRRINGVTHAAQYTIPIQNMIDSVRNCENPVCTACDMHNRECFVVAAANADKEYIRNEIVNMPNYFCDYKTAVNFISEEEFFAKHQGNAHGGFVIRSGNTGLESETKQVYEFSLNLNSNPEFTASVLVAYARAICRMASNGETGARSVFEIAPALLSPYSIEDLRKRIL